MPESSPQIPADQPSADRQHYRPWTQDEVTKFLIAHKPQIRAIASNRLQGYRHRFADSEDVFSSVCIRLLELVQSQRLRPRDQDEVWALAAKIAANAAVSKSRLLKRLRQTDLESSAEAPPMPEPNPLVDLFDGCASDDEATLLLHRLAASLGASDDRQIFILRLRGMTHELIAKHFEITPQAARQRWSSILKRFRQIPREELFDV